MLEVITLEVPSAAPDPEKILLHSESSKAARKTLKVVREGWKREHLRYSWFSVVQLLLDLADNDPFDQIITVHGFLCRGDLPGRTGDRVRISRSLRMQHGLSRACFHVYVHRARQAWCACFVRRVRQDSQLAQLLRAASCAKPGVLAALRARRGTPPAR